MDENSSLFGPDIKVAENDKVVFYANSWTKAVDQWASEWGLKGVRCLVAAQKSDPQDKDYVLIQGQEFLHATKSYEAMGCWIDVFAASEGLKRPGWDFKSGPVA